MRFKSVRYVFLSSVHPDYYGGFPGFYLSSREAAYGASDLQNFRIGVLGPKLLLDMLKQGRSFIGPLNFMEVYDYEQMDRYVTEKYYNNSINYITVNINDKVKEESK